ncbi:hypothetical protein [Telluria aromaticivorans]|uniref:Uncharacterized protein n=1 Tax=Telluria aromaticivorans TaxID=2725995 RepID=A0A7Y2P191_9BURK|nr:hypothetical protein [Telluria aromaticivorans]NNG25003.1 hypothetical protein [Telluria aromaticivorans]
MSTTLTLIQSAGAAVVGVLATVPVGQVVRSAAGLALFGGVAMVFRPLLVGIGRAAMLAVRPRPPKSSLARHS